MPIKTSDYAAYPLSRNGSGGYIIPESGREFGADQKGAATEKSFGCHKRSH